MGETLKAHERRLREGWYDRYTPMHLPGLDIGCGSEPIRPTFRRWDYILGDGDCSFLEGMPDGVFATVYSSHVLEHVHHPEVALRNWWRVLRSGGLLIVCVPHRDLYEGKKDLPSRWNADHKTYWLPDEPSPDDPPHTMGLRKTVMETIPEARILSFRILDEGHSFPDLQKHPLGEYSIEIILVKP